MKKKLMCIVMTLLIFAGASSVMIADNIAARAVNDWTVMNGSAEGNVLSASAADMTAIYSRKLDVKSGVIINYDINKFTLNTKVGGDEVGKQLIKFSFLGADGKSGIDIYLRPQRTALGTKINQRMIATICYTANGVAMPIASPMWEFDVYRDIYKEAHTVSVQFSYGSYYVEVDGRIFPPYRVANSFDLSESTLTISTHAVNAASYAKIDVKDIALAKQVIAEGDWMDMGPSEIIHNADGAVTHKNIDEQYTADNVGGNYWLQTHIGAVRGYDVSKPIKLKVHYNLNGAGVWWGLYMPNKPFMPFDQNKTSIDYSDDMAYCKGIQFDNIPPFQARPYWWKQAGTKPTEEELAEKRAYNPKGVSVNYGGTQHLSAIEILVGIDSTVIKYNDEVMWDNFRLKRSDFSEENGGDGKMYPMFEFIETPAIETRGIDITIKGINVPEIVSNVNVVRSVSDTSDLVLDVVDTNNGALKLLGPDRAEIASEHYSFANGKFTIKASAFAGYAVNADTPYNFYIANNGGLEAVYVRLVNEIVALEKAVISPSEYVLETRGGATEDLVLNVDFKTGVFKSFVGGGMTSSQYSVINPVEGATTGTITIKKEWLNNLKDGETILSLSTKDVTENTAKTEFKIKVGKKIDDGDNVDEKKKGCGSIVSDSFGGIGACISLVGALAFIIVCKRKKCVK